MKKNLISCAVAWLLISIVVFFVGLFIIAKFQAEVRYADIPGGAQGGGTASCYIADNKMRDISTVTSGKQAAQLLGISRLQNSKKEIELQRVIDAATAANINTGLMIAIWGQESGFSSGDGKVFGVLRAPDGFGAQLNVSVATVNRHLKAAEGGARQISDPNYGPYTAKSQFDYVMTRYTPTYHPGFGNDPDRSNLIGFLKKLVPNDLICEASTDAGKTEFVGQKFPVDLSANPRYSNDWLAPRTGHQHAGTDILAKRGSLVIAVSDGMVQKFGSDGWGGKSLTIDPPGQGQRYYYAHIIDIQVSLNQKVKAGQVIAKVGTANNVDHLHFGIKVPDNQPGAYRYAGNWWINPYPFLLELDPKK